MATIKQDDDATNETPRGRRRRREKATSKDGFEIAFALIIAAAFAAPLLKTPWDGLSWFMAMTAPAWALALLVGLVLKVIETARRK